MDPEVILETSHGRRSIDTIRLYDPSKATWDCEFQHISLLAFAPGLEAPEFATKSVLLI